jgi:hypothetical protein
LVLAAVVVPASADQAASEANEVSDKVKEGAQHKGKGNREVESCGLRVAGQDFSKRVTRNSQPFQAEPVELG